MRNPFQEKLEEDVNDSTYVTRSLHGDEYALESLILRHQSWIYNIAFSMMHVASATPRMRPRKS